jgi:flagellar P-ring protein precursor FlgI
LRRLLISLAALAALLGAAAPARAGTVRDIAEIKDAREHPIFGVGLVVGLRGTGDKGRETQRRIAQLLSNIRFNAQSADLATKNVALVFVTAKVKPFAQLGSRLDVTVSSMGDASSLDGGELLPTPLGANNPDVVYARAQGALSVTNADGTVTHPTAGIVTNGATLEREIPCPALETHFIAENGRRVDYVDLVLHDDDYSRANSVAEAVNTWLRTTPEAPAAKALGPGQIRVEIPERYKSLKVSFLDEILNVPVVADPAATVVINERTKVLVATGTVRISPATILVNGIEVKISENGTLEALTTAARKGGYSSAEMIAIVKELARVGALQAKLISH